MRPAATKKRLVAGAVALAVALSILELWTSLRSQDYRGAGSYSVRKFDQNWVDGERGRSIPVRIYEPLSAAGKARPLPVIVFSPGLGGSRSGYSYFGEHMAGKGFVVIALTHQGSDRRALTEWLKEKSLDASARLKAKGIQTWLKEAVEDPQNLQNRPKDVSKVIDLLETNPQLSGKVDTDRVGVAGHSFGAYTAMAVGGMRVQIPEKGSVSFLDRRAKAIIAMSPQGPGTMGIIPGAWDEFSPPAMFLSGTLDFGAENWPRWRKAAFDEVEDVDVYWFTLTRARHSTFAGNRAGSARHRRHIRLIESFSVAFFDAYLKHEPAALRWLKSNASSGHFGWRAEFKPAS